MKRFAVLCHKDARIDVVFAIRDNKNAAELDVSKLAAIGCPASVSDSRPDDVPGKTRRKVAVAMSRR